MEHLKQAVIMVLCTLMLALCLLFVCGCENKNVDPEKNEPSQSAAQNTPAPTATPRPTFDSMPTPVSVDTDFSSREHLYNYDALELPTPEKLRKAVIHEDFLIDRTIAGDGSLKGYVETSDHGRIYGDEVLFYENGKIKSWRHTDGSHYVGNVVDGKERMFDLYFDENGNITECNEYVPGNSKDNEDVYFTKLSWPNGLDGKASSVISYNQNGQVTFKREYGENDVLLLAYDWERKEDRTEHRKESFYGENGKLLSDKESIRYTDGQVLYEKTSEYYEDGSIKNLFEAEYDKDRYVVSKQEIKDGKPVAPEKKDPIVFCGYVIPRIDDIEGGPYDRGNEHAIVYKGSGYKSFTEKSSGGDILDSGYYPQKGEFSYTHKDEQGRIIFNAHVNEAEEVDNFRKYTYEVKDGLNVTTYVQYEDGKALFTHVEAKDADEKMVYMFDYDGEFGNLARINNAEVALVKGTDSVVPVEWTHLSKEFDAKTGGVVSEKEYEFEIKYYMRDFKKVSVKEDWQIFVGTNLDLLEITAYSLDEETLKVKETYRLKDTTGKITSVRELFENCVVSGTSVLEIKCREVEEKYDNSGNYFVRNESYYFEVEG